MLVFLVYLVTLAPTTAFWDTSEYIAAAKTLGIPHPPGNPLFVVLAHVFGLLPLAASYSVRINLFAAVTSALAAGFWFLVAERWLRNLVEDRTLRLGAAAAGVLVGAFSWTVWNQSTVNEKVYTVSLFWMALATWLAVHWGDDKAGAHRDRWLVLIAYVIALNSTNHMMGVLAAPALAVYVLWTDWRIMTRPWAMTMGWFLFLAVSGVWQETLAWLFGPAGSVPGGLSAGSILVVVITLGFLGWAAVKDWKNPLLYLGILAVLVGVSLNYVFLPIRAGQFPADQRGRAGRLLQPGLDGRPQPGAVPEAVGVRQTVVPLQRAPRYRAVSLPARQLLAVLQLAVRPRLARCVARVLHRALRGHRPVRALEPDQAGQAGRDRRGGDALYPDHRAGLLPEFQVRLLDAPGPGRHRCQHDAGGPRAGLLLHGLVRVLRDPGGGRVRRRPPPRRSASSGAGWPRFRSSRSP